jgi:hypothetical protein
MSRAARTSVFLGLLTSALGATMFQAPPSQLPVAYWNLDEAAGANMDSIGGLSSTVTGTVGSLTTPLPAFSYGNASARSFTTAGNPDYVQLGSSAALDSLQTNSYSISAWFRPASLPPAGTRFAIVMKPGDNEGLSLRSEAVFEFTHWTADFANFADPGTWSAPAATANTWYHVVGAWDGTGNTAQIFLNGASIDSRAPYNGATGGAALGGSWNLGIADPAQATPASRWQADGAVDDVRFYTFLLNANQVAVLFNGVPAPTGLTAIAASPAINLSWTAPPQAVAYTYNVGRRLAGSTGAYTILNAAPISGTTYGDATGVQGTAYEYVVYAVSVAISGPSASATATAPAPAGPPPPPPPPPAPAGPKTATHHPCGCGTATASGWLPLLAGLASLGLVLALRNKP